MESVEAASNLDSVIHKTSEDFAEFLKISSASYVRAIVFLIFKLWHALILNMLIYDNISDNSVYTN